MSAVFPSFKKVVEKYFKKSIVFVYSNNSGEFIHLKSFFAEHGISHFLAPPYTLEPNSTTEHYHRHIVEIGMTMLHLAKLPLQFCLHAFLTAAYLINRIPTPVLNNDSPFVCLHGHVPNYSKLQVFGCLCYPWFQPYNTNKLQPRLSPCVFFGIFVKPKSLQVL